jgi:hypothetical protein
MSEKKAVGKTALLERLAPVAEKHEFADGSYVYIRMMLATERDEFEQSMLSKDDDGNMITNVVGTRAKLLTLTLLDENKQRMFGDGDAHMVGCTIGAGGETLDLFKHAQRLNGFGGDAVKAEAKKSEAAPAGGSPSVSALLSDPSTLTTS